MLTVFFLAITFSAVAYGDPPESTIPILDWYGQSMSTLCQSNNVNAVKSLVETYGAQAVFRASSGSLPGGCLRLAAAVNKFALVDYLLRAGADVNGRDGLDEDAPRFMTPLHSAAWSESISVMRRLLNEENCEIDPRDDIGETPLRWAIRNRKLDSIYVLAQHGASLETAKNVTIVGQYDFDANVKDPEVLEAIEGRRHQSGSWAGVGVDSHPGWQMKSSGSSNSQLPGVLILIFTLILPSILPVF